MKITLTELKQIIRNEVKREREIDDILNEGFFDFFRGIKGTIGLKLAKAAINYVLKTNNYKEKDLTRIQRQKIQELKEEIEGILNKSFSEIGEILKNQNHLDSEQIKKRIMSNNLTFEDFQRELSAWRKTEASGITSRSIITDDTVRMLCDYFGIDDKKIDNKSEFKRDLGGYLTRLSQESKDQVIYQLMQAQAK